MEWLQCHENLLFCGIIYANFLLSNFYLVDVIVNYMILHINFFPLIFQVGLVMIALDEVFTIVTPIR